MFQLKCYILIHLDKRSFQKLSTVSASANTRKGRFGSEKVNFVLHVSGTDLLSNLCPPFLPGSQCRQQMTFWNVPSVLSPKGSELRGQGEVSAITSNFPDFYGLQPDWLYLNIILTLLFVAEFIK